MSSASHFIRQYCCETTLVPTDMNTKMKQVWSLRKRVNRLMRIYGIDVQLIFQPQAPKPNSWATQPSKSVLTSSNSTYASTSAQTSSGGP